MQLNHVVHVQLNISHSGITHNTVKVKLLGKGLVRCELNAC